MATNQTQTAADITEFLENDDAVDSLSAFEVKDVYVRGRLMQEIIDDNDRGFIGSDDCEHVKQLLSEGSGSALIEAAIIGFGRTHSVVAALGWENGPGNTETLFDKLTVDKYSEELLVENARKQVKTALGCCGIEKSSVMRSRVNYHNET